MKSVLKAIAKILIIAVLAFFAWFGIKDFVYNFSVQLTSLQRLSIICQVIYGGLSVASLFCIAFKRESAFKVVTAWGVALTFAGALAAIAWGGASAKDGILAGLLAVFIAVPVAYGTRSLFSVSTPPAR